ncbi:MAG: hypothetical protein M1820_008675 [Bogoriella megaspora]|nr:MAG: hypothetical protein M1820_008675 [Bogoriella megaspora]
MSKRTVYTTITPLPSGIGRSTVIDTLHDHLELIDLSPLVIKRFQTKPPGFASAEEFHCIWYQITDKVQYLPGGIAKGNVSYHVCFHDLTNGVQSHCYAPLGLDIKDKWTIGGNLPGEPREPVEMGLGAPKEGLYLREDIDMRSNFMTTSFVKKTLKKSHEKLVARMIEKAHLTENKNYNERLRGSDGDSIMSATSSQGGSVRGSVRNPHYSTISSAPSLSMQSEESRSECASPPPLFSTPRQTYQNFDAKPLVSPDWQQVDPAFQYASHKYRSSGPVQTGYVPYQTQPAELHAYPGPRITNPDTYDYGNAGTPESSRPAELPG